VIPNPVDLHFGSAITRLDGAPGYTAVADPVDPGFAKRAGGVAATLGVPVAIPDWPLGVEIDSGGEGGVANRPISASSPDGSVSVDAVPAQARASQGPGTRVDADAAVQSLRVGTPSNGGAPSEPSQSDAASNNTVASALSKAANVLRDLAARTAASIEADKRETDGSLMSVTTAKATSSSGWSGTHLEAAAATQLSGVQLLDGTVHFDAVRSFAVTRTGLDGKPSDQASVVVTGARIADIPVTIDAGGVHVDEQAVGGDGTVQGLQDALNAALKQAGVRIGLVESKGDGGAGRGVGLEVVVPVVNEQFRENNELAFRLATVETSSRLNPESVVRAPGEDEPLGLVGSEPDDTSNAVGDSASEPSGSSAEINAYPPNGAGGAESGVAASKWSSGSSAGPDSTMSTTRKDTDIINSLSDVAVDSPGQDSSSESPVTTGQRRVEFAQPTAAHHRPGGSTSSFSKGEASVLLVALGGQAAFAVLVALRRFFSGSG
jgi:hypothetical protein